MGSLNRTAQLSTVPGETSDVRVDNLEGGTHQNFCKSEDIVQDACVQLMSEAP